MNDRPSVPDASTATDAIVLCGPVTPGALSGELLPHPAMVIVADVGFRHARALGLRVDVLVGDMDSLCEEEVADAQRGGARVERHPLDKDATDLELALDLALASRVERVLVIDGGVGPRVDHFLANALVLAHERYAPMRMRAALGESWVTVVRPDRYPTALRGSPHSIVSLLPVGGPAEDVHTEGLRWPLVGEDLQAHSTRGVSNEMLDSSATIRIGRGTLLVVQPWEDAR